MTVTENSPILKDGRIVSTGYNGTPYDMPNCDEGGCERCNNRERYASGTGYHLCICVHAEQNRSEEHTSELQSH